MRTTTLANPPPPPSITTLSLQESHFFSFMLNQSYYYKAVLIQISFYLYTHYLYIYKIIIIHMMRTTRYIRKMQQRRYIQVDFFFF